MAAGEWWAYGIAVLATLMFGVGTYVMFQPPAPDCGADIYCEQAAYERLRITVLVGWGFAIVLMLAALALLAHKRRERLALRLRVPMARSGHAADGRRANVARAYEDLERRRRGLGDASDASSRPKRS